MALPTTLARLVMSVVGPELLKLLKKAAADPRTREQANAIIGQIRSGVSESTPAARARLKLLRDLDATVALARGRVESARDETERTLAESWLHDAQDIRHAADIAGALGRGGQREMIEELQQRRQALLLRMLEATVPDAAPFVDALLRAPAQESEEASAVALDRAGDVVVIEGGEAPDAAEVDVVVIEVGGQQPPAVEVGRDD